VKSEHTVDRKKDGRVGRCRCECSRAASANPAGNMTGLGSIRGWVLLLHEKRSTKLYHAGTVTPQTTVAVPIIRLGSFEASRRLQTRFSPHLRAEL
jgi:hypothetical protein